MAVEPIITNEKEYKEYQDKLMEEEAAAIAHPTPTVQYEIPIGPERPSSFREKVETKARDIKEDVKRAPSKAYESIKSGIGNIKKNYEKNVEYERDRAETERKVKSSPEYIRRKAEHEFVMSEQSARRQASAPRRSSTRAAPSLITMGNYKPAYSGKSTSKGSGFGGVSYQPAFRGQMMNAPVNTPAPVRVFKLKSTHTNSFGSGAMPKIGNFGGSSLMPKIGGQGKKIETPKMGNFTFGSIPKIGGSITHKGSVKSIGLRTNIGVLGEIPKIEFGMNKKPIVKKKSKRRSKKR
jgi:hypothetical protein